MSSSAVKPTTPDLLRRLAFLTVLLLGAGPAAVASAGSYPWPVRPFGQQHPIRGYPGDPRTVFERPLASNPFVGPGVFGFHQGVDIVAPDGTPVYPVADGVAHYLGAATLNVVGKHHVTFQYFHIVPVVGEGQRVVRSVTVLGYVQAPFGHVHLSEIDGGHIVDPLQRGHLTPYHDRTRPRIGQIVISRAGDIVESKASVCGRVQVAATAWDEPALPVPGTFAGLPVTPAYVAWSLARKNGKILRPWTTAADFRRVLPRNRVFWKVYARGSYENAPRFGRQQFTGRPGRYLFLLSAHLDTTRMRNGAYVLKVRAMDERGNKAQSATTFAVRNGGGVCRGSLAALQTALQSP
jgi:murein DD-endopeptidase MepM/ murein hydrolase activator NlpD